MQAYLYIYTYMYTYAHFCTCLYLRVIDRINQSFAQNNTKSNSSSCAQPWSPTPCEPMTSINASTFMACCCDQAIPDSGVRGL